MVRDIQFGKSSNAPKKITGEKIEGPADLPAFGGILRCWWEVPKKLR
jgi:hypothetical protein